MENKDRDSNVPPMKIRRVDEISPSELANDDAPLLADRSHLHPLFVPCYQDEDGNWVGFNSF